MIEYKIRGSVVYEGIIYSSCEIEKKVKRIQKQLCNRNNTNIRTCAIFLRKSVDYLAAIFSCLNLKITFVPIDINLPDNRIEYMLNKAKTDLIITEKLFFDKFSSLNCVLIDDEVVGENAVNPLCQQNNIAYILFTSGSTGMPKGTMITYAGFDNFCFSIAQKVGFQAGKNIASFASPSFDIFLLETVVSLMYGLNVYLTNYEEQSNVKIAVNYLKNNPINILQMTPSRLKWLQHYDQSLFCIDNISNILIGGEALPADLFSELKKKKCNIFNLYGPTEATIWVTVSDLTNKDTVDIGKPLSNVTVEVLDNRLKKVDVGEIGEICISGVCLAEGYIDDDSKSAFVRKQDTGEVIYKTGDLGELSERGDIIYRGRLDQQIKRFGKRIELEEIQAVARSLLGIKDAVAFFEQKSKRIFLFYIAKNEYTADEMRVSLCSWLPQYMIPDVIVPIGCFKYTHSGKIDRAGMIKEYSQSVSDLHEEISLNTVQKTVMKNVIDTLENGVDPHINTRLDEMGINSLNYIKILIGIENDLHIELDDEIFTNSFENLYELSNYILCKYC